MFGESIIIKPLREKGDVLGKEGVSDVILAKDLALQKAKDFCRPLPKNEQIYVVARIFEHSIDDGIKVAETLRFTALDITTIIESPEFYLKHSTDAERVAAIGVARTKRKDEKQRAERLLTHFSELRREIDDGAEIRKEKANKNDQEIIQELDRAYEPFLSTKKIEIIEEKDPRSSGERLGEKNIELIKTTLEKNYYPGDVLKILFAEIKKSDGDKINKLAKEHFESSAGLQEKYKQTGLEAYVRNLERGKENGREIVLEELRARLPLAVVDRLEWDSFVSQDDLDKIKETFNLTEKSAKKFAAVRYQPLDLTFNRQNDQAQKTLIKEIKNLGGQLGIDEQGDFSLANKVEGEKSKYLSEEKILDKLDEFIASGVNKGFIAISLAGLDSDRAWKMRDELIASDEVAKASIAKGLAGLDSDRAWRMRDELILLGTVDKVSIALGLAGLDSDRAWKMRDEFIVSGEVDKDSIAQGLSGVDSDRAWKMRDEFIVSGEVDKDYIAQGLSGVDSDRAWKMRDEFIASGVNKDYIAEGLSGLDSDRAWKMRDEFIASGVNKGSIAQSLAGDYITFVWQLKNKKDKRGQNQSPELSRKLHLLNILHTLRPDLGGLEVEKNKTEVIKSKPPLFTEEEAVVLIQKFNKMGEELAATQVAAAIGYKDTYRRLIKKNIYNSDFVAIASRLGDTELLDSAREVMDRCLKMEEFFRAGDLALALKDKETVKEIIKKLSVRTNLRDAIKISFLAASIGETELVNYYFDNDFRQASGKMVGAMLMGIYDIAIKTKNRDIISKVLTMQRLPEERDPIDEEVYHREEEFRMGLLSIAIKADDSALRIAQSLESEKDYEEAAKIFIALGDIAQTRRIISKLRQDDNFESIAVITDFYYSEEGNRNDINDSKGSSGIETVGGIEGENHKYLSEEKILDKLDEFIASGFDEYSISLGLAGLDSDRAWKMRDEFIASGKVDRCFIAQGLAGVDSDRAWKMRDEFITSNKVNKGSIALSLAGLDSDRAWKMRNEFMASGEVDKDLIAQGLAGLDSDRAWKMRDEFMASGEVDKDLIAQGLAGLDSDRAWKMRDEFMALSEVHKGYIAQGLAGLDSDRAWKMRDEFIASGKVDKNYIATGLAGLDSDRAWKMRDEFITSNIVNKGSVALGLAGLDSDRAWKMRDDLMASGEVSEGSIAQGLAGDYITFVWQLKNKLTNTNFKNKKIELSGAKKSDEFDSEKLLIDINNYLEQESKIAKKKPKTLTEKLKKELQTSRAVVKSVNSVIKDSPEIFLNMLAARKTSRRNVEKLAEKVFPSISEKDRETWRGFSGYSGFELDNHDSNREPSSEDYLNPDQMMDSMVGGDPEKEYQQEVMRFREPIHELVVTGIFGKHSGSSWDSRYQFSVADISSEKTKDITITLPHVGQKTKLPKPVSGMIIKERVKAIKKGKELTCETEFSPLGEGIVKDTKKAEEIMYSVRMNEIPGEMRNVMTGEYESYKKQFVQEYGKTMITPLAELPEEMDLFVESIKNKDPKEKVVAIENFVRQISHYDLKNREVAPLKVRASLEDRFNIMESRADELREQNKLSLEGKKYAGVCADFAVLTSALLRQAGFASGVLTGFMPNGKTATIANAHGTAFVVWPTEHGGNEIFSVDGTPTGIEGISGASIEEKEKIREGAIDSVVQDANKKLDEIMSIIKSQDLEAIKKLTNGDLETAVNTILKYETTGDDLFALQNVLDAYWYTPFSSSDMSSQKVKKEFEKFFEKERAAVDVNQVVNPGSQVFDLTEKFIQKFEAKNTVKSKENAIQLFEQIIEATGKKLSLKERKVYIAVATYLKAKKMKGKRNSNK